MLLRKSGGWMRVCERDDRGLRDVAKQKQKASIAKPISSNPLFPAVVALWFGALFGLGSLAVRPSLLEELVLNSHIDLVVPAAAPPLGVTTRILLTLTMAALGAILGVWLARRLTRPQAEVYERKRGAQDLNEPSPHVRPRDAHPDAPARRPISAHEELGSEPAVATDRPPANGPGMLANRRRALAIIHEEPQFVPQDFAPLPGSAATEPLDLADLAQCIDLAPQPAVGALPSEMNPASALDWSQPGPLPAVAPPSSDPVMMNPTPPSAIVPEPEQARHDELNQGFGTASPALQAAAPRQIFGMVADGHHLPQDFVKAAGFQTSVFDTPNPSPLFVRPEPAPSFAAEPAVLLVELDPPVAEPLPSPASLGITDLAERLAESMRRRRERAQQPVNAAAAPIPSGYEEPASAMPDIVGADTTEQTLDTYPPAPPPLLAQFAATSPAPAPAAFAAPRAIPAAMRPLALDAFLEDDAPFDASLLPPRHIAMPRIDSAPAQFAAPAAQVIAEPDAIRSTAERAEDDALASENADSPYASLLGLTPPRAAFVRIDAPPSDASEAIEPVVIFPGQSPQVVPTGAAAAPGHDDRAFRRFDAPTSAGQGQPIAANSAAVTYAPAEAEQALRAALSNLQRMSGAA